MGWDRGSPLQAFVEGFLGAFQLLRDILHFLWLAAKDAAREYFVPVASVWSWLRSLRWERGRQGSGYDKLLLGQSTRFMFDVWLLRYPTGSFIAEHTDPVATGLHHYRCNIVLWEATKGGEFETGVGYQGTCPIINTRRIKVFRPDITPHKVSRVIQGTRYVLSVGWVRKQVTPTSQ